MTHSKRFYEIDVWRSFAIIGMVVFHIYYGLDFFNFVDYEMSAGLWDFFGDIIRWSFLVLVGIGMQLSYQRYLLKGKSQVEYIVNTVKRGILVLLCAAMISIGSYMVLPSVYIYFGVLHLIGTSIIFLAPLVRFPKAVALMGLVIVLLQTYIHSLTTSTKFLVIFGLYDENFASLDYFPIIPWMAVPAFGIFLGSIMFKKYQRNYPFPERLFENRLGSMLVWIGKNSLLIYILHIPVLYFSLVYLAGF